MTARELMEILKAVDPDTPVLGRGYEDGFDAPTKVVVMPVAKKKGAWYNGAYESYTEDSIKYNEFIDKPFTAVVLF